MPDPPTPCGSPNYTSRPHGCRREKTLHQMETNKIEGTNPVVHDSIPQVCGSIRAVLNVLDEQIKAVQKQISEHIDTHPDIKHASSG